MPAKMPPQPAIVPTHIWQSVERPGDLIRILDVGTIHILVKHLGTTKETARETIVRKQWFNGCSQGYRFLRKKL